MSHDEEFYTDARSLKTAVRLAINRFRRGRQRIKGWKMEKKGGEIGWNKSSLMNVSDQGFGRVKVERLDKIQGQDTVGGKLMIIRRKVRRRRKKETI